MMMVQKKAAAALLAAGLLLSVPTFSSLASQWEERAERGLGTELKQRMEEEAKQAALEDGVKVFWLAPAGENGQVIPGPNEGIPLGAVFYSSTDQVWQPLEKTVTYPNSVHQTGGETGTVFISWNNGRGRLFPYSAEQYQAVSSKVSQFLEQYIREGMTDFEKEMQIIQYLVENITYPYERYRAGTDTDDDHSAYGALVKGEAVCEGYAEAFCWLADACGLETKFIYGIYQNELHDWNMVKLEGHWYQLDITSDDPEEKNGVKNGYGWGNLCNEYLNLTDDEMLRDHRWQPFSDAACQMRIYGPGAIDEWLRAGNAGQ